MRPLVGWLLVGVYVIAGLVIAIGALSSELYVMGWGTFLMGFPVFVLLERAGPRSKRDWLAMFGWCHTVRAQQWGLLVFAYVHLAGNLLLIALETVALYGLFQNRSIDEYIATFVVLVCTALMTTGVRMSVRQASDELYRLSLSSYGAVT